MLSYVAHEEGHSNHVLCTSLWSSVVGCPWSLRALAKPVIEDAYSTAVESITDYIYKFSVYST